MTEQAGKLKITDLVLRDAHQSLFATRMRIDDMLPIAEKIDELGLWSVETWGGATFDSCIRFLGEDPWERIRKLKEVMPKTPHQMLLRGQNILGYRHYADDVVYKFVERAAINGVDVFRIFDAMNDSRNFETATKAVIEVGKHAQCAISYTVSDVHTTKMWVDMAIRLESMGAHSICIKDMAGLLRPYVAYDLVSKLKEAVSVPIHLHSHATTGMSTATIIKAAEAGADGVDVAISSMSMTYGHSSTEAVVAILEGTKRDTGLDIVALEEIAAYFRRIRPKYKAFEGALQGTDSRILVAQVPGGMLTNLENQLRKQNVTDKLDQVLEEIPKVRADLGYLALVTPTSQIVGTQAVANVLMGERYASITKETAGVLKGEYGSTPAPVNKELQARVLEGAEPVTCRPADLLEPEVDKLTAKLEGLAKEQGIKLANPKIDDVLIYALFPQVGLKFLKNRGNPDAFEPVPDGLAKKPVAAAPATTAGPANYTVTVNGNSYQVAVSEGDAATADPAAVVPSAGGKAIVAPLAGDVTKVVVTQGQKVAEGDIVVMMEAMKMETQVRTDKAGTVTEIKIAPGDAVDGGDPLIVIA